MSLNNSFTLLCCLTFLVSCGGDDSDPESSNPAPTLWDNIKNNAAPSLLLNAEFNPPTKLANVSTLT